MYACAAALLALSLLLANELRAFVTAAWMVLIVTDAELRPLELRMEVMLTSFHWLSVTSLRGKALKAVLQR